ncbi:hypothetical protein [Clostridium perfringens]|uniref:hypothetical protein n=1 Tax=Clostridium perfringens TaxID=1502 RepID=UPI001A1ACC9D|nr:hypothetical protein [Clostridium perfringens]WFB45223.1 hypothetical protein P6X90_02175 [Clostridium perfringens]WFD76792.1 hypothetical protein P6978_02175 [Clostridium perfringens]WFD85340.1 hypothetical protein P7C31_02195 [Clostridium perfringens]WFD98157.1 hypothetical protein P7D00_02195 [Clostridium perfringens]HAT4201731.1 hypothetical protein [Clostridium perfringens]
MVNEKFGILAKIFLLILILVPITFRVYDLYYSNSSWDINSKVVKRGKVYRNYIKEKKLTGVPNIYYKYNSLTPEEMMTLDVLANTKGYNIEEVFPDVEKYVLSKNHEKNGAKLNEYEKIELNKCVKKIKDGVNENLEKNSSYIYWMKMLMSVFTALMIVLSIYAIYMTNVFINEK